MTFAAHQQREYALGRSGNVIPFGSPVLVKNKVFGVGGKFDLDDRWQGGIYVGPSSELRQGHVVRFPAGRIVTSLHVRPNVVDPDAVVPLDHVEASFPVPSRRIRGTRSLAVHEFRTRADPPEPPEVSAEHEDPLEDAGHLEAAGVWTDEELFGVDFSDDGDPRLMAFSSAVDHPEPAEVSAEHEDPLGHFLASAATAIRAMKPLSPIEVKAERMAEDFLKGNEVNAESMLILFEVLEETKQVFSRASRRTPTSKASSWATGAFTHGGVSGLRNGSKRMPAVTSFFARFARDVMGAEEFATVVVQKNGRGSMHRDFHNKPGSRNWVCPLTSCVGGGLWVQAEGLEPCHLQDVAHLEEREVRPGTKVKGCVMKTKKGESFAFDPRVWHEAQAHEGDRVMVVAFSPKLTNFDKAVADYLSSLGFLLHGRGNGEPLPHSDPAQEEKLLHHEAEGASLVNLNEAQQQLLEDLQDRSGTLRVLLEEEQMLAEDLKHAGAFVQEEAKAFQQTIDGMLKNAAHNLSRNDQAMLKVCLKAAMTHEDQHYEALIEGLTEDLQVVHTVPLHQVRPVIERWHGAIQKELSNLFEGGTRGASVESFRTVLALSAFRGWRGATSDITGAFLLAAWPAHLSRYAVVPPKVLVEQGYTSQNTFCLGHAPVVRTSGKPCHMGLI